MKFYLLVTKTDEGYLLTPFINIHITMVELIPGISLLPFIFMLSNAYQKQLIVMLYSPRILLASGSCSNVKQSKFLLSEVFCTYLEEFPGRRSLMSGLVKSSLCLSSPLFNWHIHCFVLFGEIQILRCQLPLGL